MSNWDTLEEIVKKISYEYLEIVLKEKEIIKALKDYVKTKCDEQREKCTTAYYETIFENNGGGDLTEKEEKIAEAIKYAPEPEFD